MSTTGLVADRLQRERAIEQERVRDERREKEVME